MLAVVEFEPKVYSSNVSHVSTSQSFPFNMSQKFCQENGWVIQLFPRFDKNLHLRPFTPSPNGVCFSPRVVGIVEAQTSEGILFWGVVAPKDGKVSKPWPLEPGWFKGLLSIYPLYPKHSTLVWYFSRWWQLKYFYFHPEPWGRWTHFDEHIFQMGWFNHQPVFVLQDLRVVFVW